MDLTTLLVSIGLMDKKVKESVTKYSLEPATATQLGGIKVGAGLEAEADGTLNVVGGGSAASDGGYYTPKVSDAGDLSWTASKSNMPAVATVNIKGQKGDPGVKGEPGTNGTPGTDGYTPVRGVDYWTNDDKAEIKAYVDEAILGGAW